MIEQLRPLELAGWLAARQAERPLVLDVRELWEVEAACIAPPAGAELQVIPMHALPARVHEIERGRAIACLCHHGGRSMQVALFLARQGFERLANVAGGIDAWSLECDPGVPRY